MNTRTNAFTIDALQAMRGQLWTDRAYFDGQFFGLAAGAARWVEPEPEPEPLPEGRFNNLEWKEAS